MIIKGFLRRYERWNPVHPTVGAFWGMGLGLGCGVGWGPGFGPEVIGYVGAGCGVGFSVGFTFAGLGVGLPANYLFRLSHSVIVDARRTAGPPGVVPRQNFGASGWNIMPHVSVLQSEAARRISTFRGKGFLKASGDWFDSKTIPWRSEPVWKSLGAFRDRVLNPRRGPGPKD
ncbi:hypothetical protein MLD38_016576 [Melastoma candidum]|uniref:Uncharacterized protein n=1 Tax=Melastoma candidum TaxID=119954 RepID=A0ACB9QNE2_9MYRT|nr:hypothetical protein MLD38_016576 [Melastoma candidum]